MFQCLQRSILLVPTLVLVLGLAADASVRRIPVTKDNSADTGIEVRFTAERTGCDLQLTLTIPADQPALKHHSQTLMQVHKAERNLLSVPLQLDGDRLREQHAEFTIAEELLSDTTVCLRCKHETAGVFAETFYLVKIATYLPEFAAAEQPDLAAAVDRLEELQNTRSAYWLTLGMSQNQLDYEPLLLVVRGPLADLRNREIGGDQLLEASAIVAKTYRKLEIWNPDRQPFKFVRKFGEIDVAASRIVMNDKTYRIEPCDLTDVILLIERPEGARLHRLHAPLAGAEQTARSLRLLLKEQLAAQSKYASHKD